MVRSCFDFGVLDCLVLTSMDPGYVSDDLLEYSLNFKGKQVEFVSSHLFSTLSLFLRFVYCFQIHIVSVNCELRNEPHT